MSDLLVVALDGGLAEVWRECADVLYGTHPMPVLAALRLAALMLHRYPGAVLVMVPRLGGGSLALVRSDSRMAAVPTAHRTGLNPEHANGSPAGPGPGR
ncbi:hypothetical protein [Streptomyces griseorubiginosus]|uniref:hypothetical protein n=1 Tax=Streptomyces griseorubiginosus TaxID=67304 RepID=UPI00365E340A